MFCLALRSRSGETQSFPLLLVACGLYYMHSFSRNDDPRCLEFDPRKWQGSDETGGKHRISALLAQAGMGVNSREASGFGMSAPLGPTFGTGPTAPSGGARKTEEPVLVGSPTGQMLNSSSCLPCKRGIIIISLHIGEQKLTEIRRLAQDPIF